MVNNLLILNLILKGGFGSGNYGHGGRRGHVGGSSPKGNYSSVSLDYELNKSVYIPPKHSEQNVPFKGSLVRKRGNGTGGYYVCSLETQQKMESLKQYGIESKDEIDNLKMMLKDRDLLLRKLGDDLDTILDSEELYTDYDSNPDKYPDIKNLYDKMDIVRKEINELDKEIIAARIRNQKKMFSIIGVPKEESANISLIHKTTTRGMSDTLDLGSEIINTLASKTGFATFGQPIVSNEINTRSFARDGTINIETGSKARIVTHEIGHLIEGNSGKNGLRCIEFLQMRANNLQEKKLNDIYKGIHEVYKEDEVAYEDHFVNVYAGKVYSDKSTEILSIGLEEITRDPIEFMRRDPEHFSFTLDLIQGKYIELK